MLRSVLVVDDDADICEAVAQALRDAGYGVKTLENGACALAHLEDSRPDVVLLDLTMPVMGGWQLLDIMRSQKRLADIPVVIISARDHDARGCRVLKKPFNLDALLYAVRDCCG